MAWIEVHQSLRDHRKILDAADKLDIEPPHMMGLVLSLWLWAVDNAPDGNLSRVTSRAISRASQWGNDSDTFLRVMLEVGLLDQEGERLCIHDWDAYSGFKLKQLETVRLQGRERQKRHREKQKEVTRDSGECNVSTVHNITLPIIDKADKPPRTKFAPPTVQDVRTYCAEKDYGVDTEAFVDFYTANGWRQGKGKPIVDWKAAVRTWERRDRPTQATPPIVRTGRVEVINGEEVYVCD